MWEENREVWTTHSYADTSVPLSNTYVARLGHEGYPPGTAHGTASPQLLPCRAPGTRRHAPSPGYQVTNRDREGVNGRDGFLDASSLAARASHCARSSTLNNTVSSTCIADRVGESIWVTMTEAKASRDDLVFFLAPSSVLIHLFASRRYAFPQLLRAIRTTRMLDVLACRCFRDFIRCVHMWQNMHSGQGARRIRCHSGVHQVTAECIPATTSTCT